MAKSNFPLRLHDDLTVRMLRLVAKEQGISMNALIERMIERELPREIESIELEMTGTLEALRAYKGSVAADWDAFARAEAEIEDPVQARQVETVDDPLGISAVFA
jgi:hypothetical protein